MISMIKDWHCWIWMKKTNWKCTSPLTVNSQTPTSSIYPLDKTIIVNRSSVAFSATNQVVHFVWDCTRPSQYPEHDVSIIEAVLIFLNKFRSLCKWIEFILRIKMANYTVESMSLSWQCGSRKQVRDQELHSHLFQNYLIFWLFAHINCYQSLSISLSLSGLIRWKYFDEHFV